MSEGLEFLAKRGLMRVASFNRDHLPPEVAGYFTDLPAGGTLILIGHGGQLFWQMARAHWPEGKDPIDRLSKRWGERFAALEGLSEPRILFPFGETRRPLLSLARLMGMGFTSPLGMTIDPEFGLWTALRCLIWTPDSFEAPTQPQQAHPCEDCGPKPCLAACPVQAPQWPGEMLRDVCVDERTREGSDCARACLSRLACPLAEEHRYLQEQRDYHGGISLATISAWKQASQGKA
ncbi:MAG: hypothetical protein RRB13_09710 [bacterium]|nr:hypothetical protein [bacterium]